MLFDYTAVTTESIERDLMTAIETANEHVAAATAVEGERSYANTLSPLEEATRVLAIAYGRGPFLGEASTDEAVRTVARALTEHLEKWHVEFAFRDDVYAAVAAYSQTAEAQQLTGERARLLDKLMLDFRMAGHELSGDERQELRALSDRLVELGVAFATNIAEHEDFLVVTRADLDGLPDAYIDNLKEGEKPNTFCVSMSYPDVVPFLDNVKNRDLRRALQHKFLNRAAIPNRPVLAEAVEIRQRIADIFGVPSWAHHSMQLKMADGPEAVFELYESVVPGLQKLAQTEIGDISALLSADTGENQVQGWDWRYYDTVQRRDEYGVDNQKVSEYLSLEPVVDGMLDLTSHMFGITYEQLTPTNAWHEDVSLYRVTETSNGELVGHFYMDLFPREGKFSHAAAWPLVPRHGTGSEATHPVSAILANFPKPSVERPSLLSHDDVVTLFHEFGHILHMTFSEAEHLRFSGAGTEWDFVEAPSQIMEHWCWKPEILSRFARHHETGEPIPIELVDQLEAARNLNQAFAKLRQISFGTFDMLLHGPNRSATIDEALVESGAISLLPWHEDTFFPASFGHMFGYDAGYYGYLWAEVYGDDMFSKFEEEGIANPEVGMAYRLKVLAPNGTKDGLDLVRDFLGREPSSGPFLKKLGIA